MTLEILAALTKHSWIVYEDKALADKAVVAVEKTIRFDHGDES